jgi:hypothetical protein
MRNSGIEIELLEENLEALLFILSQLLCAVAVGHKLKLRKIFKFYQRHCKIL